MVVLLAAAELLEGTEDTEYRAEKSRTGEFGDLKHLGSCCFEASVGIVAPDAQGDVGQQL